MHNDLMLFNALYISCIILKIVLGQTTTIYVKRGDVAELCDNRSTLIYAYEYQSFDGKKNSIIEPTKNDRYSNPYRTSLLRINNANEGDSGLYKCPMDDIEWQKLQIYVPIENVHLNNLHTSNQHHAANLCGSDQNNCLVLTEGQPLDIICASDGDPRPAIDVQLDKNGTVSSIMALANGIQMPALIDNQFKPSAYEAYRILGLTSSDHGRSITCHADMKHIDKKLTLSVTKKIHMKYRPTVVEKFKRIHVGINRTTIVNCTVSRANPSYINFSVNDLPSPVIDSSSIDKSGLIFSVNITPRSIDDLRSFTITANNTVGFDTCEYRLVHGVYPDPIKNCTIDTKSSNVSITITCVKSYAQGGDDGYFCTLHKLVTDKNKTNQYVEYARSRDCRFSIINTNETMQFRVGAFNQFGSVPLNTNDDNMIVLNPPMEKGQQGWLSFQKIPFQIFFILFTIVTVFVFICCICGSCHRYQTRLTNRSRLYQKDRYPRSSTDSEALKPVNDDVTLNLVNNGNDKHKNGAVYDVPIHLNGKHVHQLTSPTSVYHQQKSQQSANLHYIDQDSIASSLNSLPIRTRTFNNKFYGNPIVDNKYGPLSATNANGITPMKSMNNKNEIIENDEEEEEEDGSPVYSTTTDVMSESGSFLVSTSSSSKRRAPPPPKPRYSTLSSVRLPLENSDTVPLPLPKPRSRSNSRTRLNNGSSDNSSYLYEERPVSSSDSGIGPSDVVCLPNGDTIRSGLVKSRQNSLQKHYANPPFFPASMKSALPTPSIPRGTEC